MKTLIIYNSGYNKNTEKIAKAMAEVSNATLKQVNESSSNDLSCYDLIGFGSGIYNFKHHKSLIKFVKELDQMKNKKAFIFSTKAKFPKAFCHKKIKSLLLKKGFNVVGSFSCKGLVTFGPAKIFGGINKGHPNKDDIDNAKEFIRIIMK